MNAEISKWSLKQSKVDTRETDSRYDWLYGSEKSREALIYYALIRLCNNFDLHEGQHVG